MQIRQMTRNIWIKKGVEGGTVWEGVGLPVLYLQVGANTTKISYVFIAIQFGYLFLLAAVSASKIIQQI